MLNVKWQVLSQLQSVNIGCNYWETHLSLTITYFATKKLPLFDWETEYVQYIGFVPILVILLKSVSQFAFFEHIYTFGSLTLGTQSINSIVKMLNVWILSEIKKYLFEPPELQKRITNWESNFWFFASIHFWSENVQNGPKLAQSHLQSRLKIEKQFSMMSKNKNIDNQYI